MRIGAFELNSPVVLAPMAGVNDHPYRKVCLQHGAAMVVSEMVASKQVLRDSRKSQHRLYGINESVPMAVQILGNDPQVMADCARYQADQGATMIDINMGCPAKKVTKKAAGSALLSDEVLVADILQSVVGAVSLPVSLKIRTGVDRQHKNGVRIAKIAEAAGICSLAVHGRTRADFYQGDAEYDTIRAIKAAVSIPVLANGDINGVAKARFVKKFTQADGVMIGRAAQGRPWLLGQIADALNDLPPRATPSLSEQMHTVLGHLQDIYSVYGKALGVKIARKHVKSYISQIDADGEFRRIFNSLESTTAQQEQIYKFYCSKMTTPEINNDR